MEFLKALFAEGEALTYDQLKAKAAEAKLNIANIADGSYVGRQKFDDKVNALSQQVTELQGQISQRDADMTDLQQKLQAAQTDAGKLAEVQTELATLQTKYGEDQAAWEQKTRQQAYEFKVREKANAISFSSPAAKRDFIREAIGKEFKVEGEALLGYDEFTAKYKAENPGAVIDPPTPDAGEGDGGNAKAPTIVLPKNTNPAPETSAFGFHFNGVRPKPKE